MKIPALLWLIGFVTLAIMHPGPAKAATMAITFDESAMSADLQDASVKDVLEDLKKSRGINWEADPSLMDHRLTLQFRNLTLEEGLKRILRSFNYSIFYSVDGRINGVKLLSSKPSESRVATANSAAPADANIVQAGPPPPTPDEDLPEGLRPVKGIKPPGTEVQIDPATLDGFQIEKNLTPPGWVPPDTPVPDSFKVLKNVPPPE